MHQSGRNTFDAVQDFGARAVAEAARKAGAGLLHVSAIGADLNSASSYARTKAKAEQSILTIKPDAVIIRPSVMFGPEDNFYNKFADMARLAPAIPLVGGGNTKFQPVYVDDVAEAVARAVDGSVAGGKIYELGGAEVQTFKEIIDDILTITCRQQRLVSLPFFVASAIGSIASLVPFITPPITPDQVILLKSDNVVSQQAIAEVRTLEGLGIQPTLAAAILPSYLMHYRPEGQFTQSGSAA
jgi:NADH dehydrogenase